LNSFSQAQLCFETHCLSLRGSPIFGFIKGSEHFINISH
jgi:hypothetical protein